MVVADHLLWILDRNYLAVTKYFFEKRLVVNIG